MEQNPCKQEKFIFSFQTYQTKLFSRNIFRLGFLYIYSVAYTHLDYTTVEDMSGSRTDMSGQGGGKGPKLNPDTGGVDVEMKENATGDITNIGSGSLRPSTTAPTVKPISNWQKGGQTFTHKRIMLSLIHILCYYVGSNYRSYCSLELFLHTCYWQTR